MPNGGYTVEEETDEGFEDDDPLAIMAAGPAEERGNDDSALLEVLLWSHSKKSPSASTPSDSMPCG